MNLIRFNKHAQPRSFSNLLDDFFNKSFPEMINSDFHWNSPSTNILETDNGFEIELAVPGINKEDINIRVEKDHLIVESNKTAEQTEGDENSKFRRREFSYSAFRKSFYLNDKIDPNKISAKYENGVLNINLEKKDEAKVKEPKTIVIE